MRFDIMYIGSWEKPAKTEFLLHGKIKPYDVCSSTTDVPIHKIYNPENFEYIGSSFTLVIDDKISRWDKLHHFYKRKSYYTR